MYQSSVIDKLSTAQLCIDVVIITCALYCDKNMYSSYFFCVNIKRINLKIAKTIYNILKVIFVKRLTKLALEYKIFPILMFLVSILLALTVVDRPCNHEHCLLFCSVYALAAYVLYICTYQVSCNRAHNHHRYPHTHLDLEQLQTVVASRSL